VFRKLAEKSNAGAQSPFSMRAPSAGRLYNHATKRVRSPHRQSVVDRPKSLDEPVLSVTSKTSPSIIDRFTGDLGVATIAIPGGDLAQVKQPRARDLSIDYLRTTLTLMVLAHHSCLAYTSWAFFDKQDSFRSTAPVVDATRWAFFDYAENFNDVFFMSLMFFISGLFVYPALRKHGTFRFIRDRLRRLGIPFAFALVILMPDCLLCVVATVLKQQWIFGFLQAAGSEGF
jgi:Acyltransferase family